MGSPIQPRVRLTDGDAELDAIDDFVEMLWRRCTIRAPMRPASMSC